MALDRTFRTWTRRWWSDQRTLEVTPSIQPVVLVDDVTSLSVPPINTRINTADSATAVVAQYGYLVVYPATRVLRILRFRATAAGGPIRYGVDQITRNPAGGNAPGNPTLLQSPNFLLGFTEAICNTGTAPAPFPPLGDDNCGAAISNAVTEVDTLVLPGQLFFIFNETANQLITFNMIQWEEIPASADQLVTSNPRQLGL